MHSTRSMLSAAEYMRTRPADARRLIFDAMRNHDCRSCGNCCKDKPTILLSTHEPKARDIHTAFHRRGARLDSHGRLIGIHIDTKNCPMLEGPLCTLYRTMLPDFCATYPFGTMLNPLKPKLITLHAQCSAILRLWDAGIKFLFVDDIHRPAKDALANMYEYPEWVITQLREPNAQFLDLPMIERSFRALDAAAKSRHPLFEGARLLQAPDGRYFVPII